MEFQMDLALVNDNIDSIECLSPEDPVSPEASYNSGIDGEPHILPRVGDQYQVKIPSLISASDYQTLSNNLSNSKLITNADDSIPLVWIREEAENETESSKCQRANKPRVESIGENGSTPKVHPIDVALLLSDGTKCSELGHSVSPQIHCGKGHRLVPGCSDSAWSDIEESSFVLGLYVFGKCLVSVKQLVGNKGMGDILSYYYGKFYGTEKYRRWSECRKTRTRKCIYGQRIFMGSRHQEFLSRLLFNESEECRFAVMEMSKAYNEGKIQLEEYIFGLKAKLGLCALVEAVGIGKGKQDLTGIVAETPRTNHTVPIRPEIPVGKACSSLTVKEIITFLTGDFRLSKAKSNDIFWEAVWPRLLARGWHSEQPSSNGIGFNANPKNALVFLLPGIKKFSRRKLVKGDHYYDSVSDVLSLVASNPSLLEIDGFKSKEENGWTEEAKIKQQEDFPNEQRPCYLKPRTPVRASDNSAVKFTVIDTSRAIGKVHKVRELRSLPFEVVDTFAVLNRSSEEDDNYNDDCEINCSKVSDPIRSDKDMKHDLKPGMIDFRKPLSFGFGNGEALIALPAIHAGFGNAKESKKPKPSPKDGFVNEYKNNHFGPVPKRRKRSPIPSIKPTIDTQENPRLQRETKGSELHENIPLKPDLSQDEKPPQRTFIDLNVPVSQTIEIDEVSVLDIVEKPDDKVSMLDIVEKPDRETTNEPEDHPNREHEANAGPLRQSRRSRPLTTKVLEAFACGFMDTKQKRKSRDENSKPKSSSKRARNRACPPENVGPTVTAVSEGETSLQTLIQNTENEVFNQLGMSMSSQNG